MLAAMLASAASSLVMAAEPTAAMRAPSERVVRLDAAGNFAAGLALAREELAGCRAEPERPAQWCFELWSWVGDLALNADHPAIALDEMLHMYAAADALGATADAARAIAANALASAYLKLGDFDQALRYRRIDVDLTKALTGGKGSDFAISLGNIGVLLDRLGDYRAAEESYRAGLAALTAAGDQDSALYAIQLGNLARNLDHQGRLEDSLALSQQQLDLYARTIAPDHPSVATALNNRAIVLRQAGRYSEAETLTHRAFAINVARLGIDHPDTLISQQTLAGLLADTGRIAEARTIYEDIVAKRRASGDPDLSYSTLRFADFLLDNGDHAAALALLQKENAQEGSGTSPNQTLIGRSYLLAARANAALGHHVQAQADAEQAIRLLDASGARLHLLDALAALARIEAESGQRDSAIASYERAIALAAELLPAGHDIRLELARGLARLLATQPDTRMRALDMLRTAVSDGEQAAHLQRLAAAPGERLRRPAWQALLRTYLDVCVLAEEKEDAFAAAQLIQFNGLAQAAQKPFSKRRLSAERQQQDADRFALARWIRKGEDRLVAALARGEAELARMLSANLAKVRARLDGLSVANGGEDAERPRILTRAAAQALIQPHEAMLVAADGQDGLHVWLLTTHDISTLHLGAADSAELKSYVADLRHALAVPGGTPVRGQAVLPGTLASDTPNIDVIGRKIGARLLDPFADAIANSNRLIVVSNGLIAEIPPAVLRRDSAYVIDAMAITHFPTVASIDGLAGSHSDDGRGIVALGAVPGEGGLPPLHAADRQLEQLARTFGDEAVVQRGEAASEQWFKTSEAVRLARTVLFATHSLHTPTGELALALARSPTFASGSDSGDADGLLTLSEIGALDLSAQIVILTACTTAQPSSADEDALASFARAFFLAGAESVIVSHWPIDDAATAHQMNLFFDMLRDGVTDDPADLLRLSQIAMRDDPSGRWTHPRYWAALSFMSSRRLTSARDRGAANMTETASPGPAARSAK